MGGENMTEEIFELEQAEKVPERVVRRVKKKTGMNIPWQSVAIFLAGMVVGLLIG